jgi:hypothetical protein
MAAGPAWGIIGAIACASVVGLEPNLVEEGFVVHVAQRLVAGEHLYRDIVFFSGPLPFELLAVLFRVFGEEIAVGRAATVIVHALATALTYAFGRRAGLGPLSHAGAAFVATAPVLLFPLLSMFYYTTLGFHLALMALYATLRGTTSTRWSVAAGVLVAAVALCKQSLGLVLAASLFAGLMAGAPAGQRVARGRAMILGGAGVALATLALYALRGDLEELVRCLILRPLSLGATYRAPFINLWPLGALDYDIQPNRAIYLPNVWSLIYGVFAQPGARIVAFTQLLYALPLSALAATAFARLTGPLSTAVWLNAALLVAMTTNLFPRSDWGHLVFVLPPAALHIVLIAGVGRRERPGPQRAAWVVSGALVLMLALGSLAVSRPIHAVASPSTWGPRVPQRPVSPIYRTAAIPRVIHYLRAKAEPAEPIFVARAEPLLYFATDTRNPTPFEGVLTGFHAEQERAILAALPRIRYVVMSDIDQPMFTYYSDELPAVQAYLERYYRIPEDFPHDYGSWIMVLERKGDRGPTAIDLVKERSGAMAWVRDAAGAERSMHETPPRLAARHNRRPLPVILGSWGGGIDYELEIPPNARFQASAGFRSMVGLRDLYWHPAGTRVAVSIRRGGSFERLSTLRIDDARRSGPFWRPLEVDLSAYAGQRVTLRLEVLLDSPLEPGLLASWGSPRIALPPARD